VIQLDRTLVYVWLVLLGPLGCSGGDDETSEDEMIASSGNAALLIYDSPYAPDMPDAPNPIVPGASASAQAFDVEGKLRLVLDVSGFPASRTFGSHLHRLACDDPMKAGGHYQHIPFPAGGMATDPMYANATNEAWLDFTTDAQGKAERELTVAWIPRAAEAKAIIFHHMASGTGGVSGPKLACLPIVGF
jgi:superoxide dismutase, Cu-Zn family